MQSSRNASRVTRCHRYGIAAATIAALAAWACRKPPHGVVAPSVTRLVAAASRPSTTSFPGDAILAGVDDWTGVAAAARHHAANLRIEGSAAALSVTKPAGAIGQFEIPLTPFRPGDWSYIVIRVTAASRADIALLVGGRRYLLTLPDRETVVTIDASRMTAAADAAPVSRLTIELRDTAAQHIWLSRLVVLSKTALYADSAGTGVALVDEELRSTLYVHGGARLKTDALHLRPGDRLKFATASLESLPLELTVSLISTDGRTIRQWNLPRPAAQSWSVSDLDVGLDAPATANVVVEAAGPPRSIAFVASPRLIAGRVRQPNVIVYLIDALRADHLGVYGYPKPTTPSLDQFARSATRFENAYANGPNTRLSVASFMTSNYPAALFRALLGDAWDAAISTRYPRLAEMFRRSGYVTGGFILNSNAGAQAGLGQGYDVLSLVRSRWTKYNEEQSLLPKAFEWIDEARSEPFFLYVHTLSVHGPWSAPPQFDRFQEPTGSATPVEVDLTYLDPPGTTRATRERRISRYDAAVDYADFVFGEFIARLKQEGLYDDAVILVIADHGDQLGEHGRWSHAVGTELSRSLLHVPMLLKLPGQPPASIAANVQLLDVFPTLCDVAGLDCRDSMAEGRSLMPLVRREPEAERAFERRPVFTEENGLSAFVGRYHWLSSGAAYDVRSDPDEGHPIRLPDDIANDLQRDVERYRRDTRQRYEAWGASQFDDRMTRWVGGTGNSVVDHNTQRQLKSLGYVR